MGRSKKLSGRIGKVEEVLDARRLAEAEADGRIRRSERPGWVRAFRADRTSARALLDARQPDAAVAAENARTVETPEQRRAYVDQAARFGIDPEAII